MQKFDLSKIPFDEYPPWLEELLECLESAYREVAHLRDEVVRLKKSKKKPKLSGSLIEKPRRDRNASRSSINVSFVGRREPKKETREIIPPNLPVGLQLKAYRTYTVQELSVETKALTFKLVVYVTPDGRTITGKLPQEYAGSHFGPNLVAHIISCTTAGR